MDYQENITRLKWAMDQIVYIKPRMKLDSSFNFDEWYENFGNDALLLDHQFYSFILDNDWRLSYTEEDWLAFSSFLDSRLYVMLMSYVESHVWSDVSFGTKSGKIVLLNIISQYGTLSYYDMVTIRFLPKIAPSEEMNMNSLTKQYSLITALQKLTPEQQLGVGIMCAFEKSFALEIARHFDSTGQPVFPAAVIKIAKCFSSSNTPEPTTFPVSSVRKVSSLTKICYYCHKRGHIEDNCFKKERDCRYQRYRF
jgi:hypothetical protein